MNELNVAAISDEVRKAVAEQEGADGQLAATFASALFSRTGNGGGGAQVPERLARLALNAFAFYGERGDGAVKLRAYDFEDDAALGPVTIIEAINDDMPFLLSSMLAEIIDRGLSVRFVAHPILRAQRNSEGRLTNLATSERLPGGGRAESFVHIEIDPVDSEAERQDLLRRLGEILDEVRIAVTDWMPMVARLREAIETYEIRPAAGCRGRTGRVHPVFAVACRWPFHLLGLAGI